MNGLLVPGWKKRYDSSASTLDCAQELLQKPEVIDALGEKAHLLIGIMEHVRARPVRSGKVEWSPDDTASTVHVISLAPGEQVTIYDTKSNPLQHYFASRVYGEVAATKFLLKEDIPLPLIMKFGRYGVTKSLTHIRPADNDIQTMQLYRRGRPTIGLLYGGEKVPIEGYALRLLHELDHATNATVFPLQFALTDNDFYLRSELSAYGTQSVIARAIGLDDERYLPHKIEQIRREFNGDLSSNEAFIARPEIANRLNSVGLGQIHR
jgi:hypothetical protein